MPLAALGEFLKASAGIGVADGTGFDEGIAVTGPFSPEIGGEGGRQAG